MILVTVGMHDQGLERLVQPMDELAAALEEEIVIQYGVSQYVPRHASAFRFTDSEHMAALTVQARVVVTHAAAGTIILALQNEKHLVLVPRMKRFGEHFDDHQVQLARALHDQHKAVAVLEPTPTSLAAALQQVDRIRFTTADPAKIIIALHEQLERWDRSKRR